MSLSPAFIWNAVAIALGVIGGVLFLWAMFWDRARGRLRCPKCWYDMKGAVGASREPPWTCPECGKVSRTAKRLKRTRRRAYRAAIGVILLLVSAGVLLRGPLAPIWPRYAPLTMLFLANESRWTMSMHIDDEVERRMWDGDGIVLISRWPALPAWQIALSNPNRSNPSTWPGLDPAGYPCVPPTLMDFVSFVPPEPVVLKGTTRELVERFNAGESGSLAAARTGAPSRFTFRFQPPDEETMTLREAEVDLDGDGVEDRLLLGERVRGCTTFISLLDRHGGWVYAGEFTVPRGGSTEKNARLAVIGGRPFVLATHTRMTGTGVFSSETVIHDLRHPAGAPVFAIPARGRVMGWAQPIDNEWSVDLRLERGGEDVAFDADYRVSYMRSETAEDDAIEPPPNVSWRVRYVWDVPSGRFRAASWKWTCEKRPKYAGKAPPMIGDACDMRRFEKFHAERR